MESSVETLKCSSCGASMEMQASGTPLRCSQCGNLSGRPRLRTAPVASGQEKSGFDMVLRIYCRVMIVLLVYVLSTGPLYWQIYEAFNTSGSSFLAKLYFPIVLVCQYSDTICAWFDWYVALWVY